MKMLPGVMRLLVATAILAVTSSAATYTVTKTADTNDGQCDSDCSLREAITAANSSAENDVIVFDTVTFHTPQTILFSLGEMIITNNGSLTIMGPGAEKLTLDGNNASRIFSNSSGSALSVDALLFTRANGAGATNNNSGGAIMNNGGFVVVTNSIFRNNVTSGSSGAIRNSGTGSTLTIINCNFENNVSTGSSAGAVQNFSSSVLTIDNSTFTGNSAAGTVGGGAIQANGQVRITNSTFSGNTTSASGGAIQSNGSLLLLTNVTISKNTSTSNGGGLHRGTTNVNGFIRNSIIAGNNGTAGSPDVTNSTGGLVSEGNNIIGNVGTSTGWVASDILNTDPLLGPYADNGGWGRTHALLAGSPALNAGQNCVLDRTCATNNPPEAVIVDHRAFPRGTDAAVDIGAYESSPFLWAVMLNAGVGSAYSQTIASNSTGFTMSSPGGLPPGLDLVTASGVTTIEGTPTVPGTYYFPITTTNDSAPGQTATNTYSITVSSDPNRVVAAGRVTRNGGPLFDKVLINLTGINGTSQNAVVSPFGYFSIDIVTGGYILSITTKEMGTGQAAFATRGSWIFPGNIELSAPSMFKPTLPWNGRTIEKTR